MEKKLVTESSPPHRWAPGGTLPPYTPYPVCSVCSHFCPRGLLTHPEMLAYCRRKKLSPQTLPNTTRRAAKRQMPCFLQGEPVVADSKALGMSQHGSMNRESDTTLSEMSIGHSTGCAEDSLENLIIASSITPFGRPGKECFISV